MKTKIILFFGWVSMATACQSGSSTVSDTEESGQLTAWADDLSCQTGWLKFANEFFAICYPEDWTSDATGTFGSDLVLTHRNKETMPDGRVFSQNINVMKQEESVVYAFDINNLDDFAQFNKNQIESFLEDAEVFKFEKTELTGLPAYRNQMKAKQNGADLYFEQFIFKLKKHYFVITYTAPIASSQESKNLGLEIMQSVKFSEP